MKALFAVQRNGVGDITSDSHACVFDSNSQLGTPSGGSITGFSSLQNFQFRIGGRYFPAAPVQCSTDTGSAISNGGAEAYIELSKALNIVGDYRLSTPANTLRWAVPCTYGVIDDAAAGAKLPNFDFLATQRGVFPSGTAYVQQAQSLVAASGVASAGPLGSACFAMSTNLETSNGIEISGLNAEEQVSFLINVSPILLCWQDGPVPKMLVMLWKYILSMTPCWS